MVSQIRRFRAEYILEFPGKQSPLRTAIHKIMHKFVSIGSVQNKSTSTEPGGSVVTHETGIREVSDSNLVVDLPG